mgnify:CR=1 FL=1
MVTTLLLVRHGQSTWNAQRRWQGQADPPLSALGRNQAASAVDALDRLVERLATSTAGVIDAVVSSPQLRAAETADILTEGASCTQHIDSIERLPDLRERSAGPWSGLTKDQIDEQYPNFLRDDLRPDGYEGDAPLYQRVRRTLIDLGQRHHGKTVLAVCHGGVINTVADQLGGAAGRMPNLSGYPVTAAEALENELAIGARFDLLRAGDQTGGDASRV